jgi:hypothetical protein
MKALTRFPLLSKRILRACGTHISFFRHTLHKRIIKRAGQSAEL